MFRQEDMDKWTAMYNQAIADGVFDGAPEAPQPDHLRGFLQDVEKAPNHRSAESEYWARMHSGNYTDPLEVFNEDYNDPPKAVDQNQSKEEIGKVATSKANAANPIDPSSVGKDQDYKPSLADVHELEQLHDMKVKLLELQGKLAASDALATDEGAKIQKQIDKIKQDVDDLSNSISPQFLQSYLS